MFPITKVTLLCNLQGFDRYPWWDALCFTLLFAFSGSVSLGSTVCHSMASSVYSAKRVYCADYGLRHKKPILKQRDFVPVSRLDTTALRRVLGPAHASSLDDDGELCRNCFRYFRSAINELADEPCSSASALDADYVDQEEIVEEINQEISSADIDITPLRRPASVKGSHVDAYVSRKQTEVTEALAKSVRRKISDAYGIGEENVSGRECEKCSHLLDNIREAYQRCRSQQEKCQLLTLLPEEMSKKEVMRAVPGVTKYVIDKSRRLRASQGVWAIPDAYAGHPLSDSDVSTALRYYMEDEMDCSVQSPNKKDVIHVVKDGRREAVVKRFMTRSIRETYSLFKANNPEIKLGMTKFYRLRPKWVRAAPHQSQCVCTYCANFELVVAAANGVSAEELCKDSIKRMCMCEQWTEACLFQECLRCVGGKTLKLTMLKLRPDDEIVVALWESGDLIRKTVSACIFLKEVRKWAALYVKHEHIHSIQRKAIWTEKNSPRERYVVLHFDFAENWTVNLPNEIQGHYWQRSQVSLFTCVAKTRATTISLATVSDDLRHDTAHALLALRTIVDTLEDLLPLFSHVVHISDGAAAHFKNRYQLYEMRRNILLSHWIFSASGHGKNACDGVGGSLKHTASAYNLRSPAASVIRSAEDFVSALSETGHATRLLYLPPDEVESFRTAKRTEWSTVRPVSGLRSSHVWYKAGRGNGQSEVLLARTANEVRT